MGYECLSLKNISEGRIESLPTLPFPRGLGFLIPFVFHLLLVLQGSWGLMRIGSKCGIGVLSGRWSVL